MAWTQEARDAAAAARKAKAKRLAKGAKGMKPLSTPKFASDFVAQHNTGLAQANYLKSVRLVKAVQAKGFLAGHVDLTSNHVRQALSKRIESASKSARISAFKRGK